jgi:hypothetical protein
MKRHSLFLSLTIILLAFPVVVFTQTPEFSLRSSVDVEIKIAKRLKIQITPEYRYNPVTNTGSVLVQAGLGVKVAPWLSFGGYYRFDYEKSTGTEIVGDPSVGCSNRFALDANTKVDLKRFTPKFRLRFCNFSDFDSQTDDKSNFLRYRFGLDYTIKGVRIAPFVSVEFYQKLSSGLFSKSRYSIGAEYAFNKKNAISFQYSFANKFKTLSKFHIFEMTYMASI